MDGCSSFLIVALVLIVGAVLLFVFTHLRPLSKEEVDGLTRIRRAKKIDAYYTFASYRMTINLEFKKGMKGSGRLYNAKDRLEGFPAIAGAMLKYKKHEWTVVAFETNRIVTLFWVNKGPDNALVWLYMPISEVISLAQKHKSSTVMWFHNHPNPNPSRFSFHMPSDTDRRTACSMAETLNAEGINILDFVCERGWHHEYHRSIADNFIPAVSIKNEIEKVNGTDWTINLSMHKERVFASGRHKKGYCSASPVKPKTQCAAAAYLG